MTKVLMKCGHMANSISSGKPACAICVETQVDENREIDLTGRIASCSCGTERPSTLDGTLAFFEYLGSESRDAHTACKHCSYRHWGNEETNKSFSWQRDPVKMGRCSGFEPKGGADKDRFYCGCRGWN